MRIGLGEFFVVGNCVLCGWNIAQGHYQLAVLNGSTAILLSSLYFRC
jgi:hypothetical protein